MSRTILGIAMLCFAAMSAQAQTITVTAPNGGESWTLSTPRAITWTSTGLPAGQTVDVVLRLNGVRVGDIAVGVPAASGSLPWTVGAYQGGQAAAGPGYQVRVRAANAILDDSNAAFTIAPAAPPASLQVLAPNGGESWATGSLQSIRWNAVNLTGNVKLELIQGTTVLGTIAQNVPVASGAYNWTVGQYAGGTASIGGNYRVGITSQSSSLIDPSDAPFSIVLGAIAAGALQPGRIQTIQLPDLVVCLKTQSHIHVPGSGTVAVKVKNAGTGASPAARLAFRIEGSGTNQYTVPALNPGQIHAVGRHEYYSLAGKSDVTVEIDDDKKVVETNENNNVAAGILHKTYDAYWPEIPYTCTDGTAVP